MWLLLHFGKNVCTGFIRKVELLFLSIFAWIEFVDGLSRVGVSPGIFNLHKYSLAGSTTTSLSQIKCVESPSAGYLPPENSR